VMPQPKTAAFATGAGTPAPRTTDVASALRSVLSPTTAVSTTVAPAGPDAIVTPTVEQLEPKSEKTDTGVKAGEAAASVAELRLVPDRGEMLVGEKRRIAVEFKSDAPLGLAVVVLRFDPQVLKINSVSAGKIF